MSRKNLLEAKKMDISFLMLFWKKLKICSKKSKKYPILDSRDWKKCLYQMPNLSKYKKIHHIGDLQGCYSVLKEYIKTIKEDEFYIFLGDYINRGIENGKVIKFLLKFAKRKRMLIRRKSRKTSYKMG